MGTASAPGLVIERVGCPRDMFLQRGLTCKLESGMHARNTWLVRFGILIPVRSFFKQVGGPLPPTIAPLGPPFPGRAAFPFGPHVWKQPARASACGPLEDLAACVSSSRVRALRSILKSSRDSSFGKVPVTVWLSMPSSSSSGHSFPLLR
jgi:hypothetical protein